MASWFHATKFPRIFAGAISAMYMGDTTDAPPTPGANRVAWNDEIVLAAVSSVAVVFSQRFVRTGVERAYRVVFGEPPVTRTRQQRRADHNAKRKWNKGVGKMPKPQAPITAS